MTNATDQQKTLLRKIMQQALQQDAELRQKLGMGEKFKFIPERLANLAQQLEQQLADIVTDTAAITEPNADETIVYVHLFNTQGAILNHWQQMLKADLFYDYSVNRPIYHDKAAIETFIRQKPNPQQHAYLAVIINKNQIITQAITSKDPLGQDLIKIKEGSLKLNRLVSFVHNHHQYNISEFGELKAI